MTKHHKYLNLSIFLLAALTLCAAVNYDSLLLALIGFSQWFLLTKFFSDHQCATEESLTRLLEINRATNQSKLDQLDFKIDMFRQSTKRNFETLDKYVASALDTGQAFENMRQATSLDALSSVAEIVLKRNGTPTHRRAKK